MMMSAHRLNSWSASVLESEPICCSNQLVAIKRVDITEASAVEAQGFRNEIKLLQKLKGKCREFFLISCGEIQWNDLL